MAEDSIATSDESVPAQRTNTLTPTAFPCTLCKAFQLCTDQNKSTQHLRSSKLSWRDRLHQIGHLMDTHCSKMLFTAKQVAAANMLSNPCFFPMFYFFYLWYVFYLVYVHLYTFLLSLHLLHSFA